MFLERSRQEYQIPSWLGWAVATLCLLAGAFITLYFGKPSFDRARASTRWPTTSGVIVMSEVGSKAESNNQLRYYTKIRYSYSVANHQYESKTVFVGDDYFSSSPASHEEIVRRYPLNSAVMVHYDPLQPQVAVLEPGLFLSNYGVLVAGLGLVSVGIWIALKTIQENRKRNAQATS